jgi:nucleoside-diphosphate-sugar epimerase
VSRVLLTGASGFVGRHALAALAEDGHEVHAVARTRGPELAGVSWHEADLLDLEGCDVVAAVEPEVLLHLAWYAEHGAFWSSPENLRWVQGSLGLLRAFAAAGGQRVVIAGSCAEYEWGGERDLDERGSPLRPHTLYGVCKDALRRIAEAYAHESSLQLAWGRLFFLYGPGEAPGRLVPSVIGPLLSGERAQSTAGEQVRDFMYVRDVADALAALVRSDVTGPVNIASGHGVSIAEVLGQIGALIGSPELIDRGARPTPASEPPRIVADVTRLEQEVGFRARVSLHDGLDSTIDWWRAQAAQPRR